MIILFRLKKDQAEQRNEDLLLVFISINIIHLYSNIILVNIRSCSILLDFGSNK